MKKSSPTVLLSGWDFEQLMMIQQFSAVIYEYENI